MRRITAFTRLLAVALIIVAALAMTACTGTTRGLSTTTTTAATTTTTTTAATTTATTTETATATTVAPSLSDDGGNGAQGQEPASGEEDYMNDPKNPVATVEMEDGGKIVVELYPQLAPNTVASFIDLANSGFYDGLIFHRVIPDFMIQGGDPEGTGSGRSGFMIEGEFSNNGFDNTLSHARGVISMARQGNQMDPASAYNTAGSQFFITVGDSSFLDGDYAGFGTVIEGMDVADAVSLVDRDEFDKPYVDQVIKKITVDTKGVFYSDPARLDEQ